MTHLAAAVLIISIGLAGPAGAQSFSGIPFVPEDEPMQLRQRGFSFPTVTYVAPTGEIRQRKGILVGKEVGPGALVGVGLFETAPRHRGFSPDPTATAPPKGKRRAAIGLSLRF